MNVLFQKISILPPRRVFWFVPPPFSGNSSLASYIPLKLLAFHAPLQLGIFNDPPRRGGGGGRGHGYFLEAHMLIITCLPCNGSDVMSPWILDSGEVLATGSLTTC